MFGTVAIVGGSLSGLTCAQTLRDEGFDGSLFVIDAEDSTAYDRPPLSKQVLAGEWDAERAHLPGTTADLGITWMLGHPAIGVDLADRFLKLGNGEMVGFDGLVIASGAAPRVLPGMGELDGVRVLRTLDDCLAIRSALDGGATRVVIVGAGFIGAEVASTCRQRGCEVVVLEALDVPLERAIGAEMGMLIADIHREHGVDVRLGTGVDGFEHGGDRHVTGVRLSDGSAVPADLVVVGIGVVPQTAWLEGSGLTVDDGVVVDEQLRAAPGVVAIGDIARWPSRRYGRLLRVEHWENAIQMGEHAARSLLREDDGGEGAEPYDPIPWFWSDQYDFKLQLAGHAGADDQFEIVCGSTEERRFVGLYGRAGRLVGVLGMNRPRHVMQLRQKLVDGASYDEAVAFGRAL
ncbi:MAG: oxidoreductase [Actinobacteria bacterium]|nr:oxidoreductase [Actinomycetota bacterium]